MAWNEFSPAEESQVAKIACQDNADRFFRCCRNYPPRVFPEGTTVNSHYSLGVMECLYMYVHHVRNEQFQNNSWLLLNDNAPAHCALNVKQFLASKSICVIHHPPYSPDLAPGDFFLFLKVKLALKGGSFSDISDIQCGVTEQLKGDSLQYFQRAFEDLYQRSQRCVELEEVIILKVCNKNF
jgi:hypothetical protein